MADADFFPRRGVLTIGRVYAVAGLPVPEGVSPDEALHGIAPLEAAGPGDLVYMDNARYADALARTAARVCLVSRRFAAKVPASVLAVVCAEPYRVYAQLLGELHPDALRPGSFFGVEGVYPGAIIHPSARLEQGVTVDPGAVIGPDVEIGTGTVIGANAVLGAGVKVGRYCSIAAGVTLQASLVGNRVIIHPGARIGQDGFGFAMGPRGHAKVPQIGRVIVQDDVEIGANTTIDRGASRDTIIGEGTKIDNQVQIGHNVVIGRHCVLVGQVGLSGSVTIEDFVVFAGKAGSVGHVRIGMGAQIAGNSQVAGDVPAGARMAGTPAKPFRDHVRELALLSRLAKDRLKDKTGQDDGDVDG